MQPPSLPSVGSYTPSLLPHPAGHTYLPLVGGTRILPRSLGSPRAILDAGCHVAVHVFVGTSSSGSCNTTHQRPRLLCVFLLSARHSDQTQMHNTEGSSSHQSVRGADSASVLHENTTQPTLREPTVCPTTERVAQSSPSSSGTQDAGLHAHLCPHVRINRPPCLTLLCPRRLGHAEHVTRVPLSSAFSGVWPMGNTLSRLRAPRGSGVRVSVPVLPLLRHRDSQKGLLPSRSKPLLGASPQEAPLPLTAPLFQG